MPLFTCILWMIAHRRICARIDTALPLLTLLFFQALFLFYDCCYADVLAPYDVQAISILVAQIATPSLVPLSIIYLRRLKGIHLAHPTQLLWCVVPAALFTASFIFFTMAGHDRITVALQTYYSGGLKALNLSSEDPAYLFFISSFVIYRIVNYSAITLFIVFLIVYHHKSSLKVADLWRFFFKGGSVPVIQLQFFNLALIFALLVAKTPIIKDIINGHPWYMAIFAVALSALIFCFCYIAMFEPKKKVRLSEMNDAWRYNYGSKDKDEVVVRMLDSLLDDSEELALKHIHERYGDSPYAKLWKESEQLKRPELASLSEYVLTVNPGSWEDEKLLSAFQRLMLEYKVFLQPRLTLAEVAEMLGSNTSYVSRLVNNAYDLGFPEFINTLRIDYAEQYILDHREARQEEIAAQSGFLSASSFNNAFKKITGMTPKVWVASVDRNAK